jgi:hypothetical protein
MVIMAPELKRGSMRIRPDSKIEVTLGSGSVIVVEQSELHNLIDALSDVRGLLGSDRALMNVGSA